MVRFAFRNPFRRTLGLGKQARRAKSTRQAVRFRPSLQNLEDRTLLTILNWLPLPFGGSIFDGQAQNITNLRPLGNNPVIGAIQAIAPHPTDANVVFAASVNGGIYKADDATDPHGGYFYNTTAEYPSLSIGGIAFSPLDPNVLYAGIGQFSSAGNQGGPQTGLLRTANAGDETPTWTMLGQNTFGGQNVIRVRPTALTTMSGQVVLVASTGGVYRSTDSGMTWTLISGTGNLPTGTPSDLMGDPTNTNRFYAAIPSSAQGVFRSDDGGVNWVAVALPSGGTRIRLATGAGGVVYAATMGSQLTNVFRSTNNGGSWTSMGVPSPTIHPGNQGGNNFSIVADRTDPTVVFVGGDRQASPFTNGCNDFTGNHFRGVFGGSPVWTSADCNGASGGGAPTSPHADSRAMAFDAAGNLLEADDGGLYKLLSPNAAANSRHWISAAGVWVPGTYSNVGTARPTEFYSVAYDSVNHSYFGGAQDIGAVEGGSDNFPHVIVEGDGGIAAADNTSQPGRSIHYLTSQNLGCSMNAAGQCMAPQGFRRRTFDDHLNLLSDNMVTLNVANTTPTRNVFQVDSTFTNIVEPYVLNNVDPRRMIIGSTFLYESTNQGDTLTSLGGVQEVPVGSGNWQAINPVGPVSALAYGGRRGGVDNADVLWVGAGGQLWLRSIGTGMPTVVSAYRTAGGGPVQALQMDPADWQTVYVLDTSSKVWTNAGGNWVEVTGNLCNLANDLNLPSQPMDLRTLEVVRNGSNVAVLVGGLGGVYRAVNPGSAPPCTAATQSPRTWTRLGIDGDSSIVTDLHYNAGSDKLFAAGFGTAMQGVFGASELFDDATLTIDVTDIDDVRLMRLPNTPQWLQVTYNHSFTFEGYAASVAQIVINVHTFDSTINIDDTFAGLPVTVNILKGQGTHTINISPTARNLSTIQGNITINGGVGTTLLNVFDQAASFVIHTLTANSLTRTGSAAINYGSVNAIQMNLANGRIEVRSLPANTPTTINVGSGTSLVWIGETTRNLDGILSSVTVNGSAGTALLIDDQNNAAGRNFTIRPDRVSYSIGANTIDVSYNNVVSLDIYPGSGANHFTVLGTADGTVTTLHPGSGQNTVDLQGGTLNVAGNGAVRDLGFNRFTVAAAATLNFPSGTLVLTADSSITGTGTVSMNGTTNLIIGGTYNVSGLTRIASPSTVTFNAAATATQLILAGGVLGGTGDLTVTDTLTWTDGTMQGSGRTLVNGRLDINGPALKTLDARRLENVGQVVWSDIGDILVSNGGMLTNQPTGVFDIRSDARIRRGNGAQGQLTNAGTLRKSAGSQATAVEIGFNNAGTVDIQTGTLSLLGGGSDSGAFTVAAGTTLGFDGGTHTLTADATIALSGTLHFGASTTTVGATIALAAGSMIAFDAGTHTLTADSSVTGTATVRFASPTNVTIGGTYNLTGLTRSTGGQANFTSDGSTTQLALEGGFIGGSADLTVTGATTWTAAGYNGTGHLRANGGITMTGAAPKQVANGTLDNAGLAVWNDGGPLQIYQGGTWNNLPGSTLEARNDAAMQGLTGSLGQFVNAGLLHKLASNGTTQLSVTVTNSGTIHVETGTLLVDGPLTNLSGTTLTGGTFWVQTTLRIPAADIRTNAATLILDGGASIISRDTQGNDALANLAVNTADGQVTIRNGRALRTAGSFDNAGLFMMEDTGALTFQGNWNNSGQFQWNGSGVVQSSIGSGAEFDNQAGATFDIRGDSSFRDNLSFINAGVVRKLAGTGTSIFNFTTFDNNGIVDVQAGTLQLNNGGASTGSFSVAAGAMLVFGRGTHLLGAASSVSGDGQVAFSGGTAIVQGNYAARGSTMVSGESTYFASATPIAMGALTVDGGGTAYFAVDATVTTLTLNQGGFTDPADDLDGSGTVTVTGLTTWTGGGMFGTGRTIALGGLVLSGPNRKWLGTMLLNASTATWTGGEIFFSDGGVLINSAGSVFDVQTDASMSSPSSGVFVNAGTLRKSAGTGTNNIGDRVVLNNSGTVDIQTGTLSLVGGSTTSGSFTIAAGATLQFAIGTHRLTESSAVSGAGRVRFADFTRVSLAGSYNLTGDTVIDGGFMGAFAEFDADASTGTLTQTGGTLTGSGTLTVTGQTVWAGGTESGAGRTIALGVLQLSGGDKSLDVRALDNAGVAVWTGGNIFATGGATLNNLAGAELDIQAGVRFSGRFLGDATVNNAGTLRVSAGAGVSEFTPIPLNNSGAIEVQTGTLRLAGGGQSAGSFTIAAGATLEFSGGDQLLTETATLTGDGQVAVTGGTMYDAGDLTVAGGEVLTIGSRGALTVAGAFTQTSGRTVLASGGMLAVGSGLFLNGGTLSGAGQIIGDVFNSASLVVGDAATVGTLTITGNYTQTADGALTVKLGGTAAGRFDRLVVSGTATLAGTLQVTLVGGYVPASGDSLRVLTAGTLSGMFDTLAGDGPQFDPLYDGTGLTLRRP